MAIPDRREVFPPCEDPRYTKPNFLTNINTKACPQRNTDKCPASIVGILKTREDWNLEEIVTFVGVEMNHACPQEWESLIEAATTEDELAVRQN